MVAIYIILHNYVSLSLDEYFTVIYFHNIFMVLHFRMIHKFLLLNILDHVIYKPVSTWKNVCKLKLKHAFLQHQNVLNCANMLVNNIYTYVIQNNTNIIWKNLKGYEFTFEFAVVFVLLCWSTESLQKYLL